MRNGKTKKVINFAIDRKLDELMNELFGNKSRYIEYLILQDMKKHLKIEDLKGVKI